MYFCLFLLAGTNVCGIGQGGEGSGAQIGALEQRFGRFRQITWVRDPLEATPQRRCARWETIGAAFPFAATRRSRSFFQSLPRLGYRFSLR